MDMTKIARGRRAADIRRAHVAIEEGGNPVDNELRSVPSSDGRPTGLQEKPAASHPTPRS
eukprot:1177625-Prorocentrum_minimum.AAC.1